MTTGNANAKTTHCQYGNWIAGTMDRPITGMVAAKAMAKRAERRESPSVVVDVSAIAAV